MPKERYQYLFLHTTQSVENDGTSTTLNIVDGSLSERQSNRSWDREFGEAVEKSVCGSHSFELPFVRVVGNVVCGEEVEGRVEGSDRIWDGVSSVVQGRRQPLFPCQNFPRLSQPLFARDGGEECVIRKGFGAWPRVQTALCPIT